MYTVYCYGPQDIVVMFVSGLKITMSVILSLTCLIVSVYSM